MASRSLYDPSAAERRFLVHILEDKAKNTPDAVFASIPLSGEPHGPFEDVTFATALKAVDHLVGFLDQSFPIHDRTGEFDVVSYIGPPDIRYAFLTYAAIKSKLPILMFSLRNSIETNLSLLKSTGCKKLVYAEEMVGLAERLAKGGTSMKLAVIPSIESVLTSSSQLRPYEVTIEEGLFHPILILHSSGSTGPPTPRTITNGFFATLGADYAFATPEGRMKADVTVHNFEGAGGRILGPFPPTHLAGFLIHIAYPIYTRCTAVWAPLAGPPTADLVISMLESHCIKGLILPPTIIEDMVHRPEGMQLISKLTNLAYAGGPLSQATGKLIAQHVRLYQDYGSTEALKLRTLRPRPEHWDWLEFHPDDYYRFDEAENGAYELVFLRDPHQDESYSGAAAIRFTIPQRTEYRTKDLFTRHTTNPHLWKFYGRRDDILVLSSGEKINPVAMESVIASNQEVSGALVIGLSKPRAAVIIELSKDANFDDKLQERLWAAVQTANTDAPGPARISKDLIILADKDKPFKRAAKGSVIRKATTDLYKREIDQAYEAAGFSTSIPSSQSAVNGHKQKDLPVDFSSTSRQLIGRLLNDADFDADANLYHLGFDSLKTAEAVKELAPLLGSPSWFTTRIFYTKPTFHGLLRTIEEESQDHPTRATESAVDTSLSRLALEYQIQPCVETLPSRALSRVCITGTTGFLGRFMLLKLLASSDITTIHCLNRAKDAEQKFATFCSRIRLRLPGKTKLVYHHVDSDDRDAFKNADILQAIVSSQVIYHIAWKVDFNLSVNSFENNLVGLHNLLNTLQTVDHPPRLVFASSVSSTHGVKHAHSGPLAITLHGGSRSGYGNSKLLAEQMLVNTAAITSVPITILRIGQIAPPRNLAGVVWPQHEWIPGLVKTSRALGRIPDDMPDIALIPVDELSQIILELSAVEGRAALLLNVVNPHSTPWKEFDSAIATASQSLKHTSLEDWLVSLKGHDQLDRNELQAKPALKTLSHFEALATGHCQTTSFDTKLTQLNSRTFAALRPVSRDELTVWLAKD